MSGISKTDQGLTYLSFKHYVQCRDYIAYISPSCPTVSPTDLASLGVQMTILPPSPSPILPVEPYAILIPLNTMDGCVARVTKGMSTFY